MVRVAAVDCGTNSMRLLIAEIGPKGRFHDVNRQVRIVRLGEGVDANGTLSHKALARTFTVGREYAALIDDCGVVPQNVCCIATSAVRDAANKQEFIKGMREALGVTPDIISGSQEAELSFRGAMRLFASIWQEQKHVLVVDLGGGSTEFVLGSFEGGTGTVIAAVSADIGCVRMRERFIYSDPPTADEMRALKIAVADKLADVSRSIDLSLIRRVVGVAGTITTVTAAALGLDTYNNVKINGSTVALSDIINITGRLARMTCNEREAQGYVHPGRADVLSAGALIYQVIAEEIMKRTHGRIDVMITSEYDILDGVASSIAG